MSGTPLKEIEWIGIAFLLFVILFCEIFQRYWARCIYRKYVIDLGFGKTSPAKPHGLEQIEWIDLQISSRGYWAYQIWKNQRVLNVLEAELCIGGAFYFFKYQNMKLILEVIPLCLGMAMALETYDYFAKRKLASKLGLV